MRASIATFATFALAVTTLSATAACGRRSREPRTTVWVQPNATSAAQPADAPPASASADPNAQPSVVSADGTFVCPGGSIVQGDGCVCPSGSTWLGGTCATCPGGSVARGDGCACPSGMSWVNEQCVVVQAPTASEPAPPVVQPPREQPPPQRSAWAPRPPSPPPAPRFNIQVPVNVNVGNVGSVSQGVSPSTPVQSPPPSSPPSTGRGPSSPSSPPPTVTYAECKNGMVRVGTACQCPQGTGWEGGRCVVTCHPTQVRNGNTCTCPKDTRWTGQRCELWQECKPGEARIGATCIPASSGKKR